MTPEQFENELLFQVTMIHAKKLLHNGTISTPEYSDFQALMLEKYQPIISQLNVLNT